jgi:ATP-binding cassette subfamily C exporter for protease/lipase
MTDHPSLTGADKPQKPIAELLRQCRHSFYLVVLLTFVSEMLSLAPIIYMWTVMDRVISARSGVTLVSLLVLIVGIYIFWSSLDWIRARLLVRLSMRIDWDLSGSIFDAAFRRAVQRRGVNVQQMLGDLLALRQFFTGEPLLALVTAPFAVIFIAAGALFHVYLAAFVAAAVVIMSVSAYFTQKVSSPILREANDMNSESQRIAAASLENGESALALGMLPAVRRRWYERHRRFLQLSITASDASGFVGGFSKFLAKSLPSLQISLGAWLAINGEITGGMVIAASMLISRSIGPIQRLTSNWPQIVQARQAYERLNILLAEDKAVTNKMPLAPPIGRLDVAGAAAIPPGSNRAVLAEVSFSVAPGEAVAVIGPSGSGKTSLTRLLVGVWKPATGSVRLDGVDLSSWNLDEVGPHIGFVSQEVAFHEGTVAENIARLGTPDPERVIEAATRIGMHDVILSFPEGYDTKLGGSGFALSGGQRQRLGIARALYGNPKYVVMDEPNASLDEIGENALMEAIAALKKEGTTFIITTHRPRLISVVDNLLVLRQGRQVGFGPAAEMIAAVRNLKVVGGTDEGPATEAAPETSISARSA